MIPQDEYERLIPENHRDKVPIESVIRIHPDDPEWICFKSTEDHSCMEMHNSTGDTTHRCCCGFEWNDN